MSEDVVDTDKTIILAGRVVGFIHPTQGQIEALIRISHTLENGPEDSKQEFWVKQIRRIGTLLDSLIVEADQELVEDLYLTGKISHSDLLTAILGKINSNAEKSENKAIAKAKANTARVKRQ